MLSSQQWSATLFNSVEFKLSGKYSVCLSVNNHWGEQTSGSGVISLPANYPTPPKTATRDSQNGNFLLNHTFPNQLPQIHKPQCSPSSSQSLLPLFPTSNNQYGRHFTALPDHPAAHHAHRALQIQEGYHLDGTSEAFRCISEIEGDLYTFGYGEELYGFYESRYV